MKFINVFSVSCSVLVYLIVIKSTLSMFYSINPFFSFIAQNFSQYALIIELIIVLIAFSIIPGFYVLRKAFKKESQLKIKETFISLIVALSVLPPMLAFLNNIFTGNLLFSAGLITYGIIFGAMALKFR